MRASFFKKFNFKVYYKVGTTYFIFNTLFKLTFVFVLLLIIKKLFLTIKKLNTFNGYIYIIFLIKMSAEFKQRLIDKYFKNFI